MWSERPSPMFLVVVVASIAAHVALLELLPPAASATPAPPRPTTFVAFEAPPPPPPPAPAPPPPEVERPAPQRVATRAPAPRTRPPVRREATPPPPAAAAEPPAAPEAPVDFSGVTLSNEGAGWASPTGSGEPMTGPIAAAPAAARRGPVRAAQGRGAGERVVAVGDLSRPPRAPDLDAALVANYPREARRSGIAGKAVVRARIVADGTVGTIRVVSESASGFGAACKQTLAGSRWQPPLDARDQPVATDVSYTCTFAVTR